MSFTVIGDTVNTTARLQALTRTFETSLVVGDPVVKAVQALHPEVAVRLVEHLDDRGEHTLRGRVVPVHLWTRKTNGAPAPSSPILGDVSRHPPISR